MPSFASRSGIVGAVARLPRATRRRAFMLSVAPLALAAQGAAPSRVGSPRPATASTSRCEALPAAGPHAEHLLSVVRGTIPVPHGFERGAPVVHDGITTEAWIARGDSASIAVSVVAPAGAGPAAPAVVDAGAACPIAAPGGAGSVTAYVLHEEGGGGERATRWSATSTPLLLRDGSRVMVQVTARSAAERRALLALAVRMQVEGAVAP